MLFTEFQSLFVSSIPICSVDQFKLMVDEEGAYTEYEGEDVVMDGSFNIAIDTTNAMSSSFYVAGNHEGSSVVEYLQILIQIKNSAPEFTAGELAP